MKNIQQFFAGVQGELLKIIWPKFDELIDSLVLVLFLVIVFSLYLGVLDFGFYRLAQQVFSA